MTGGEVAQHHLSTWSGWGWTFGIGGTAALFAAAAVALAITGSLTDPYRYRFNDSGDAVCSAVALGASLAGSVLHGVVARHIAASSEDRWWLTIPLWVSAILAGITASGSAHYKWPGYAAGGIVFVGGIIAAAVDALHRIAANIPISVSALVGLIVFGVIAAAIYSFTQPRRA